MNTANEERNKLYWQIGKIIIDHDAWGNKYMKQFAERILPEGDFATPCCKILI